MAKINKLSEYMAFVEALPKEFTLSRGQSEDFPLLPSAMRKDDRGNRRYSKRTVRNFLDQFKINCYQYMSNANEIQNDVEWMLYAQHYGIPTRLLDFTTSHIVSLLFAVEKAFQNNECVDAVVYFLDPIALNSKFKQRSQIINVSDSICSQQESHDGPFAIQGRKINPRVNAQKGLFVLFQDDDGVLEGLNDTNILRKVVINGEETKNILAHLFTMGINFAHIYPELPSVAKDIVMQQDIEDFLREQNQNGE